MNYKNVNDYEVLYMIRENSEEATDLLYSKYSPIIKSFAYKYYLDNSEQGADIDDFIQEASIGFSEAVTSYNENRNVLFYTYVLNVIDRRMLTYVRNLKIKKNLILNKSLRSEIILSNIRDCRALDHVDKTIEEKFLKLKLAMDFKFSTVFELRFNGFSYKEIAVLLDIPMSTVQSRISKIKQILRNNLRKAI